MVRKYHKNKASQKTNKNNGGNTTMANTNNEGSKKIVFGEVDPKQFQVKENRKNDKYYSGINMEEGKITINLDKNGARIMNALTVGLSAAIHVGKELTAGAIGYLGDAIEKAPDAVAAVSSTVSNFKGNFEVAMDKMDEQRLVKAAENGDAMTVAKIQMKQAMKQMQRNMQMQTIKTMQKTMESMYNQTASTEEDDK